MTLVEEIQAKCSPEQLAERNFHVIAAVVSEGRTRTVKQEIGYGTIVARLRGVGDGGGAFLDALATIGQMDRDVFYTLKTIEAGVFDTSLPETRGGMEALAEAVPALAPQIEVLLTLGQVPDPVSWEQCMNEYSKAGL